MLIYLLRHGEAETLAASDSARELTQSGVVQTRATLQKFLARKPQPRIDKALMSPLQRARQTAALVTHALPGLAFEVERGLEPGTDVHALLAIIERLDAKELLLVGHNPLLATLLSLLIDGTLRPTRPVGTSQLYCVEMDFFAPGCGEILYTLVP